MVEGRDLDETTSGLQHIMECCNGGFSWSNSHNSRFEISKLAVMHFTGLQARSQRQHPVLELRLWGQRIEEVRSYKYLGVVIDSRLTWHTQVERAVAKAMAWVLMFWRLTRPSTGVSSKLMRWLYLMVGVPKLTYAAEVWYMPPHIEEGCKRKAGSVAACKQFEKVQRMALIMINGAM
jgi:hypothetical protein